MTRRPGWCLAAIWCVASVCVADAQVRDGRLIEATKKQDAAAVRALLKQRADVNATAADGSTALHWAAQRNDAELVTLLLGAGAKATTSTRYNVTPLYLAALNGNAAIMTRLLDAG